MEGTMQFLQDLLGLTVGFRPNFGFPGCRLYNADAPIVHLVASRDAPVGRDVGTIDHVGFRLEGYGSFRRKLEDTDIVYSTMDLPELGERRLFVCTPGGILLELVLRDDVQTN